MLRDAAMYWVQKNCKDPKLQADFSSQLEQAMRDRVDCWFAVGHALTRRRVPYLIHCFAGELFVFQIDEQQARSLMLAPHALAASLHPSPVPPGATRLVVSLSDLVLDAPVLTTHDRIDGSCAYEIVGEGPDALCLRLDGSLALAGDVTDWHFPEQILDRAGRFRFSFNQLASSPSLFAHDYRGPLVLFLRACTSPPTGEVALRHPISNTCGTLVNVVCDDGSASCASVLVTAPCSSARLQMRYVAPDSLLVVIVWVKR